MVPQFLRPSRFQVQVPSKEATHVVRHGQIIRIIWFLVSRLLYHITNIIVIVVAFESNGDRKWYYWTPTTDSLLFAFLRKIWPMPHFLVIHSALALFAQRTRIPTSACSVVFCAIWVSISSSWSIVMIETKVKARSLSQCTRTFNANPFAWISLNSFPFRPFTERKDSKPY